MPLQEDLPTGLAFVLPLSLHFLGNLFWVVSRAVQHVESAAVGDDRKSPQQSDLKICSLQGVWRLLLLEPKHEVCRAPPGSQPANMRDEIGVKQTCVCTHKKQDEENLAFSSLKTRPLPPL